MKSLFVSLSLFLSVTMIFFTSGCGDDNPSDGGPADTTPPAVTDVSAVDGQHVQVTFDEDVLRATAEETRNYSIVEHTVAEEPAAPGTVDADAALVPVQTEIVSAARISGNTVLLSLSGFMSNVAYDMLVNKVSDANGNVMADLSTTQFQGSDALDTTAPFIVSRNPAPNASGVGTGQAIVVVFSEPMQEPTVFTAFRLTTVKGQVAVAIQKWEDNQYLFSPVVPMERSTSFTAAFQGGAVDLSGNPLSQTSWTFRTTGSIDTTPPAVVSTTPVDGATGVPTDTFIALEFSEPIERTSMKGVLITPVPGDGIEEWSNGDRKVGFTPDDPLLPDTQYLLVIPKGFIRDLAGNGNTESYTIQFTTGASFAAGRIEGTLSGDPFSVQAADPTGALVIATTMELFGPSDDMDVVGVGTTEENDTYSVERLPDAVYFPFAILDSNNDGMLDPETGDALGAYGANIRDQDFTQNPVIIESGSTASQVDFPLFDPVTIAGAVLYDGTAYTSGLTSLTYWVGVFDAATFDPENPGVPVAGREGGPLAWNPYYVVNQLDSGLEPGTYYVGCYLDVNSNGEFDPGLEPSGYYANAQTGDPLSVIVEDGTDVLNVNIHLADPQGGMARSTSAIWGTGLSDDSRRAAVRRAFEKIREAVGKSNQ